MTEFRFEDPDLMNSTLEIGFPSCAIEKDNFTDSQGKQIRTENKESVQAEVRNKGSICVVVGVPILVAKAPYSAADDSSPIDNLCRFYSSREICKALSGAAIPTKIQLNEMSVT